METMAASKFTQLASQHNSIIVVVTVSAPSSCEREAPPHSTTELDPNLVTSNSFPIIKLHFLAEMLFMIEENLQYALLDTASSVK